MAIPVLSAINTTAKDITDRRDEWQKWFRQNYLAEFEEAWRNIHCRTKQILVKDEGGKEVEDTSRTNVCMPETWLIARRKTARQTANPPQINYTTPNGGENAQLPERLTALAYQQYDRSGEAIEQRSHVHQANVFGISFDKTYWSKVEVMRQFRYDRLKLRSRRRLMELQGADADQIEEAVQQKGEEVGDQEIGEAIASSGANLKAKVPVTQYEGPVTRMKFFGDMFLEPGFRTCHTSAWMGEEYEEALPWLKMMLQRKFVDDDGQDQACFDPDAVKSFYDDLPADSVANLDRSLREQKEFREELRAVLNQTTPTFPSRLIPGKRFRVIECHERDKDGKFWITWVGNDKIVLGRQPYPWDLYGRYMYGALVPMPDILGGIGDSSPRALRYLQALHNASVGRREDLANGIARRTLVLPFDTGLPSDQLVERRGYRILYARNPRAVLEGMIPEPDIPNGLFETDNSHLRMFQLAEPMLGNTEAGTDINPQGGKTATSAILGAKASDSLTNDELQCIAFNIKDRAERKLWMMQQDESVAQYQVQDKYRGEALKDWKPTKALTDSEGQVALVSIHSEELQQEIELEPEAASILSVDDELRRNATIQAYQLAENDPATWNKNYMAMKVAGTLKGIDPQQAVNPPAPPAGPEVRVNASIAIKWGELTADEKIQVLQKANFTVTPEMQQEAKLEDTLKAVGKLSQAGDAAANLDQPVHQLGTAPPEGVVKYPKP